MKVKNIKNVIDGLLNSEENVILISALGKLVKHMK